MKKEVSRLSKVCDMILELLKGNIQGLGKGIAVVAFLR